MRLIILGFIIIGIFTAGCSKKIPDDQVTAKVAEALCGKIQECGGTAAIESGSCVNLLKTSLLTPLNSSDKKGKVTEKELSECVKGIKSQNCAEFSGPTPPKACGFFKG